jgi:hypothetical protein
MASWMAAKVTKVSRVPARFSKSLARGVSAFPGRMQAACARRRSWHWRESYWSRFWKYVTTGVVIYDPGLEHAHSLIPTTDW